MVCVLYVYVCVCVISQGPRLRISGPAGLGLIHQQQQVLVSKRGNMRETRSNKQTEEMKEKLKDEECSLHESNNGTMVTLASIS